MAAREYGQHDGITRARADRRALGAAHRARPAGRTRRYSELAAGLPRIPSNILAARLKELQEAGVLRRAPHSRVVVYELAPYGRELEPVVLGLGAWGFKTMDDPREEQIITPDSMTMTLRTAFSGTSPPPSPRRRTRRGWGPPNCSFAWMAQPRRDPRRRAKPTWPLPPGRASGA